jgi:hypothetical protein
MTALTLTAAKNPFETEFPDTSAPEHVTENLPELDNNALDGSFVHANPRLRD